MNLLTGIMISEKLSQGIISFTDDYFDFEGTQGLIGVKSICNKL